MNRPKVRITRVTPIVNACLEALTSITEDDNEFISEKQIVDYVRENYPEYTTKEIHAVLDMI